ncbi:LOW QUALITY PROTEIN: complement factor B-like protease, partial [Melanerpes formicivorus]|uniref:LOW QUALITY PROTEIN: complement factor B-like protease n=1 Tax=Melanerpes formicivorus TaxID=211600 RepID=UPI00358E062C
MAERGAPPRLLLLLLLLLPCGTPTPSPSPPPPSPPPRCDPALAPIAGGWGEVVWGGEGLRYRCPPGQSPSPISLRRCLPGGEWEPLPGAYSPSCGAVFCPPPVEFEHGSFWPRGGALRYAPGSRLHFSCFGGFELRGDPELLCGKGGRWLGTTPVCDDGAGDCPAPAVPPGASRSGSRFSLESRVRFRCAPGLKLLGSAERRCLEGGVWSGAEPQCRAPNSFDDPQEVAASFMASLTQAVELAEANNTQ